MEIVLLWLDDLDDLVFSAFYLWQKLRPISLVVGFAAAISLHILPEAGASAAQVSSLVFVSLAALLLWVMAAVVSRRTDRRLVPAA